MGNKKVLITGGTGLVGSHLIPLLQEHNFETAILSRKAHQSTQKKFFQWDINNQTIDPEAIEWADVIIHLAGANVGDKRWSSNRKKIILESRTKSTQLLKKAIQESGKKDITFISASAIGIYETNTGSILEEEGDKGDDFLAQVTKAWESEVENISSWIKRAVIIRIGVVFSNDGGAFTQLAKPIKYYVGAPLGTGKQMVSWIHIHDLCRIFLEAINNEALSGAVNATAPSAASNKEVTKIIANTLNKPLWLPPIPGFVLKLLLGEMATVVLSSCHVYPKKLINNGFTFKFTTLKPAVKDLLKS